MTALCTMRSRTGEAGGLLAERLVIPTGPTYESLFFLSKKSSLGGWRAMKDAALMDDEEVLCLRSLVGQEREDEAMGFE
jgi:hypothetical protein